jgi:DNA-directed RNA polymerase subunit beta
METVDYGDTDYRYEIEGDRKYDEYESSELGQMGYQAQEFDEEGELVSAEDDEDEDFEDADAEELDTDADELF